MKILKKISLLAVIFTMMTSATAVFADEATKIPGGKAGSSDGTALTGVVEIEKELVVYNPSETTIAGPSIQYNYALTAGSAEKTITDSRGITANTFAGILPATTTASVAWTNDDVTAAAEGASNKKTFTFDFSGVEYPRAGIYRYVVTETTNVEKGAAGVEDGTISNVRYLDVYVRDARTGETKRPIYGYVLMSYDNAVDGRAEATANTEANAVKTTGFVASKDSDGSTDLSADFYKTYNLTVGKTLEGDSFMNNHEFPFTVTFENGGVTQNVLLKVTKTGNATIAVPAAEAIGTSQYTPKIATGATVKYIGIPKATSAQVYETEDVHGTTYYSSYSVDGGAYSTEKPIMEGDNSETASLVEADETPIDHTIQFKNVFALISPTGVAWRVAPYAMMMTAGIVIYLVGKRRREEMFD